MTQRWEVCPARGGEGGTETSCQIVICERYQGTGADPLRAAGSG